jgi:YggT family protein
MRAILDIILIILELYVWLLIAAAILSWLVAFNVVNTRNQFVSMVGEFLYRITEPLLAPIRSVMPNLGTFFDRGAGWPTPGGTRPKGSALHCA